MTYRCVPQDPSHLGRRGLSVPRWRTNAGVPVLPHSLKAGLLVLDQSANRDWGDVPGGGSIVRQGDSNVD